jgi:thiopurine S-methyltransferase
MEGPPFSVSEDELRQLFTDRFTIERLHSEDVIETRPRFRDRGLDRLIENVFQLRRR